MAISKKASAVAGCGGGGVFWDVFVMGWRRRPGVWWWGGGGGLLGVCEEDVRKSWSIIAPAGPLNAGEHGKKNQ